jgi:hypothetical protein
MLGERLTRIESGTIKVGNECADGEGPLQDVNVHLANGLPGNRFVVDGHAAPSCLSRWKSRLPIKAPLILWRKMKAAATPTSGAIRVYGLEGTFGGPKI